MTATIWAVEEAPALNEFPSTPVTIVTRSRWAWVVATALFVQYTLTGIWLLSDRQYAIGDSIARTLNAQVMVLSRDPHLGAMGFYWMPLPMLIRIPFVLVLAPFESQMYAGPLSTALLAALVVPVLVRIAAELRLATMTTVVLVAVYALNPVTVFSAANGMSEAAFALFLALTLLGLIRFGANGNVRSLAFLGASLAGGLLSRIEFIPITIAAVLACLLLAHKDRWRRIAAMVALPPLAVFMAWSFASRLIVGDAFYWYHEGKASGATPATHPWMPASLTPTTIAGYVGFMALLVAPAIPIAVGAAAIRRHDWRRTVGLAMVLGAIPAFIALQLLMRTSWGNPRYFAVLPLGGCVLAMWALSLAESWAPQARVVLGVLLTAVGVSGAVVATYAYSDPTRTSIESESVFFAAITGRPAPDYPRRFDQLQPLVDYLDPELATGKIAVIDTRGGIPLLMSSHPQQFIIPEDRDFEQIMSDPTNRFDFVVLPSVGLTSRYRSVIEAAMKAVQGGTFVLVKDFGSAALWQFQSAPT
jgi:Dolichyl-phosphate-mannose-protein mannosyltransferase